MGGRLFSVFRLLGVCVSVSTLVFVNACSEDCSVSNTCAGSGPTDGGGALDGSAQDSGPDGTVPIPEGCDPNADPKDAPKCVVSDFGIFVDAATGNDGNSGSKELPMKSIAGALAKLNGRPRIYVCEGTYPESVKLTLPISIYGGFACGTWAYTGVQPKVAPGVAGAEAVLIEGVTAPIVVADIHADAASGDATKKNSIAMRIRGASDVRLVRVKATAATAVDASDRSPPATNMFSSNVGDLTGVQPTDATGGPEKTCQCKIHGSSKGGKGGNGGDPAQNGSAGGSTPIAVANGARNSAGGNGYPNGVSFACEAGKPGPDGSPREAGVGAANHGVLSASGWNSDPGTDGAAGNPGSGGGGGGGGDVDGSGGGGCGGCGGSGGQAGEGGGSSIALVIDGSVVRVVGCTFAAALGGKGGAGASGEAGGAGGGGASGACGGGRGGNGAGGSGGGGGAGGISVGVLRRGGALTRDAVTTVTFGVAGKGGVGGGSGAGGANVLGTAPSGSPGTAGTDGVAQEELELAP